MALPDFLVIGAPKAGFTAVHQAVLLHEQLFRDDIALLEDLLGESFQDRLADTDRGTYALRSS